MAVELVIKIDEEDYKAIKNMSVVGDMTIPYVFNSIRSGIPLPKGHGDLIDANELLKMTNSYKSELGRLKADPFVKSGIETVENFIRDLPTIIEADKEE